MLRHALALFLTALLTVPGAALAQVIPGEPAPVELHEQGTSTSTLTRGENLQLASGSGQAGTGPMIASGLGATRFGLPLSFAYGLGPIEGAASFTMLLSPLNVQTLLVSDFTLAGRYAVIPKTLALDFKLGVPGALTRFAGLSIGVDGLHYAAVGDKLRLYTAGSLKVLVGVGFAGSLTLSETAMFLVTEQIYTQALLTLPFAAGYGVNVPVAHLPLTAGVGGGYLLGENSGIGGALTMGFGGNGPVGGVVHDVGFIATYTKGI